MEKLLETNHYLVSFDFDEENLLLFNSDGGSLIVMEKKHFHDNRIETSLLSEKEIDTLVEMGFLIDNKKNHFRIIDDLNKKSDELVITIEVIDSCNLNCDYCYQLGWKPRGKIKKNVSGKIIRYIDSCLSNEAFRKLKIRFIGGEPLLAVDEIKYLYSKIHSICKANGVELKIGLDTNGIFLTYDILQLFDDSILDLSVTLTSKEDHDLHRVTFGGNGTYDIIVSNLKKCKELFKKKNLNLYIRYNVNSENISLFDMFLDELKTLDLQINSVETMYTYTYDNTRYKNSLDYNEYKKWNTDVAIDLLIKREFSISFFPQVEMRLCRAYQPFCCKFFANGKIGLCDASKYNDELVDISVINDNYRRINQIFKEQKMYSPFNEELCKTCKQIIMCGGRYFCKNNPCDYERYVLETFLKKYIYYREKGLGHCFTGIQKGGVNKDEGNYQ